MHSALRERLHALKLEDSFEGDNIDILRKVRSETDDALRVSGIRKQVIGRRIAEVEAKLRHAPIKPRDTTGSKSTAPGEPAFPAVNRGAG